MLVPVEASVEIKDDRNLYQIAAYITKVSTTQQLEKKAVTGIIIDKENFNLVFHQHGKTVCCTLLAKIIACFLNTSVECGSVRGNRKKIEFCTLYYKVAT